MLIKWKKISPLNLACLSWAITLGNFSLGELFIRHFGWQGIVPDVVGTLAISAAIAPFGVLFVAALNYKRNANSIDRIIRMFLAVTLLCANINFVIMLHFSRNGDAPFQGIHSVWLRNVEGRPQIFSWNDALLSAVDCFHFSVETLSTVGYGDIYATTWYAKLAVDLEIFMGLGITVLTVGRHYSGTSLERKDKD